MSVLFLLLIEVVFDHLGGQLVQQLPSPCISHVAVCNLSLWHSFSGCHLVSFFFYCLCNCAYVNGQVAVYHAALWIGQSCSERFHSLQNVSCSNCQLLWRLYGICTLSYNTRPRAPKFKNPTLTVNGPVHRLFLLFRQSSFSEHSDHVRRRADHFVPTNCLVKSCNVLFILGIGSVSSPFVFQLLCRLFCKHSNGPFISLTSRTI